MSRAVSSGLRALAALGGAHPSAIRRFSQARRAGPNRSDCRSRTIPTCVECIRAYQKRKPPRVIKDQAEIMRTEWWLPFSHHTQLLAQSTVDSTTDLKIFLA
ncbi:unnamed protein product [Coccothraustes coccothraustes]